MIKLCDINPAATAKLPPAAPDKSGIGVHYVDAFVAPMNAALPDGTRVSCKRRGLKVTLKVGPVKKGDGLMRRLAVRPRSRRHAPRLPRRGGPGRRRAAADHRHRNPHRPLILLLNPATSYET